MAIISRIDSRPGHRRPSPQSASSRTRWRTGPSSFSYSASRRAQRSSACVGGIMNGSRLCGARPRAGRPTTSRFVHPDPQMPETLNDRAADNWRPLLAIADLAGGEWPQLARQACLTLSGESPGEAKGVMLLADCGPAFGDDDV